ncbi:MAG: F0F1 ATP synthase subunit alpha, partial [Candidatus Omnitrophica bacterium]|nr:F0F1 ATP synthase subunit alpha [Candidatus Omnitrophota bacterium]
MNGPLVSQQIHPPSLELREVGTVTEVKHGIVRANGLPSCIYGQLVDFSDGITGMVIGFHPSEAMIIVLGDDRRIHIGDQLASRSELLRVPVGEAFIGRLVNCLGNPIDDKGLLVAHDSKPVFRQAAGVMEREPITEPFLTGLKVLDLMIPIGKGQRELILGDRQTGKTSIALDAILNQRGKDITCIYCWIGGSFATFKKLIQILASYQALSYTLAVCAFADSSPAEQYLCPYTAATLGESFMSRGRDVLVVFDDLTRHAWAYRQMSLLMERSPGREAYPGDIFYVHAQLMERAGRLKAALGGGTMTFLPIAETVQGDIAGYIPSNLIAMTDGQIYLSAALFHEGFKPAIDLGLSVSRIGSKVQSPAMRELSQGLRLGYTQYRELLR